MILLLFGILYLFIIYIILVIVLEKLFHSCYVVIFITFDDYWILIVITVLLWNTKKKNCKINFECFKFLTLYNKRCCYIKKKMYSTKMMMNCLIINYYILKHHIWLIKVHICSSHNEMYTRLNGHFKNNKLLKIMNGNMTFVNKKKT